MTISIHFSQMEVDDTEKMNIVRNVVTLQYKLKTKQKRKQNENRNKTGLKEFSSFHKLEPKSVNFNC